MSQEARDIVVVGAGPSGCILARNLAQAHADFIVLERAADVGGIWDIDAAGSPVYESAHFISSKHTSGFVDFPMPEHFPDYPNHRQIFEYISSYADAFNLRQHMRFNTEVQSAQRSDDGRWRINLNNGTSIICRYLICANGVTWIPNEVQWPGSFTGEQRHSKTYRSSQEFIDKRVLIVGGGNSGVDIACDAACTAKEAYLSLRRGYHFLPKFIFGKPADVFDQKGPQLPTRLKSRVFSRFLRFLHGDLTRLGLPKPDHRVFESHPIMNTQILHHLGHGDLQIRPDVQRLDGQRVYFTDDSWVEVDLLIAATGYRKECPFLEAGTIPTKDGRFDLYLNIFPRNHQNLAIMGFVEFASAAYTNFEAMARLIVADATQPADSAAGQRFAKLKTEHRPKLGGAMHYVQSQRHANYIDVRNYRKTLSQVGRQVGVPIPF